MTRDDIIRMAKEVGLPKWYQDDALVNESLVLKFANLVAAAEREACAKVCDKEQEEWGWDADVVDAARAIRERGAP